MSHSDPKPEVLEAPPSAAADAVILGSTTSGGVAPGPVAPAPREPEVLEKPRSSPDRDRSARKPRKKALRGTLAAALCAGLLAYGWWNWDEIAELGRIAALTAIAAVGARFGQTLLRVEGMMVGIRRLGASPDFSEVFTVAAAGGFVARQIVPIVGAIGVKAVYLRERYGLDLGCTIGISSLWAAMCLVTSGLLALMALATREATPWPIWAAAVVSVAGGALGIALARQAWILRLPLLRRRPEWLLGFQRLALCPRTLARTFALSALWAILGFTAYGKLLSELGGGDFRTGGLVASLSSVGVLVQFTPGNLGVYEWLVGGISHGVGTGLTEGAAAAVIFRMAGYISLLPGLAFVGLLRLVKSGLARTPRASLSSSSQTDLPGNSAP